MFQVKVLCAGALWMLAVTLMVVADFGHVPDLRAWSLLAGLVAWMPTHLLFACHGREVLREELEHMLMVERHRTERLIQALAIQAAEADIPRITPHSRV